MKNADVSIGILGTEEVCCGDSALRTGNEELFRECAITNLRSFTRYGGKKNCHGMSSTAITYCGRNTLP